MFEKGIYRKSVALGVAAFLGACGSGHNQLPKAQNLPEIQQPDVPFNATRCAKFAIELTQGKRVTIYDRSKNEYGLENRGQFVPKGGNPPRQTANNTVEVDHAYVDNAGHGMAVNYIYDYGELSVKYSNNDAIRVAIEKLEDPKVVGVTGWACG